MFVERLKNLLASESSAGVLLKGSAIAFVIQGVGIPLKYLMEVALARWSSPQAYGHYSAAYSWVQLFATISCLGITFAVLRFIPAYESKKEFGKISGLINWGKAQTIVIGLIVGIIGFLSADYFYGEKLNFSVGAVLLVPLTASIFLHRDIFRAFRKITLAYIFPAVVVPVLMTSLLFVFHLKGEHLSGRGLIGLAAVCLAPVMILQYLGLFLTRRSAYSNIRAEYNIKFWLSVAPPLMAIEILSIFIMRLDIMLVAGLRAAGDAGIYAACAKTALLALFPLGAVNAISASLISSHYSSGNKEKLQRLVTLATDIMAAGALVISLPILIFTDQVLGIFGPDYLIGKTALRILIFGQLFNASSGPAGLLLLMTGHEKAALAGYVFSAVVALSLNLVLISILGIDGAALATAITIISWNLIFVFFTYKKLGIVSFAVISHFHKVN